MTGPEDLFEIKKIFKAKRSRYKLYYYFTDWKSFHPEERFWELVENFDAPELIHRLHLFQGPNNRAHKEKGIGTIWELAYIWEY